MLREVGAARGVVVAGRVAEKGREPVGGVVAATGFLVECLV